MRIMGVDPGGTTGVALIDWSGEFPLGRDTVTVKGVWEHSFEDVVPWMYEMLPEVDAVAVERYQITGRTLTASRQYEALYVIGGVLFLTAILGGSAPDVRLNTAANAKNAWTDERLADVGLGPPKKMRHARDALRHALLYCHGK